MDLPTSLQDLLRDEAYTCLGREAVQEQLVALEREKVTLLKSRPPFGILRRKETLDALERSMLKVTETEEGFKKRLAQLTRFDQWLQQRIRSELGTYLAVASPEFQTFGRLHQLFLEWDACADKPLRDLLTGFGREMRELRQAATDKKATRDVVSPHLPNLRAVAVRLEEQDLELARIADAINKDLQSGIQDGIRLPALPHFRRIIWVDWLSTVPFEQLAGELTRIEAEVSLVLRNSIGNALAITKNSRDTCARRQNAFLLTYWSQLRTHAQTYYVEERDVDGVLALLAERYEPEITRSQLEATQSPFPAQP